MKMREFVNFLFGTGCGMLASYSASAILTKSCPKTGDWKKDLALKAGCSLIGGVIGSTVEKEMTKTLEETEESILQIRDDVRKMKEQMVEKHEEKEEKKYTVSGKEEPESDIHVVKLEDGGSDGE